MKLKKFQREDLSRAALHDGLILGWEPGMGKTIAMFVWPLLKVGRLRDDGLQPKRPVLLVASGDLHSQIREEAKKHFGIIPVALDSQETFLRLSSLMPDGRRTLRPDFYITSYAALGQNGVEPVPEFDHEWYCTNLGNSRYYREIGRSVRCIHSPTLADLCQDAFEAIVCDEGVRIKGQDSLIGLGVRQMAARFRLILTGTPIKNRIGDIFHLAHFVSGSHNAPHPRFPYGPNDQPEFVRRFSMLERNLTAENKTGRRHIKPIPHICSVGLLYKLLAPIVLRRTKENCGEEIVTKLSHTVRVPMGIQQAGEYRARLGDKIPITTKLQALRRMSTGATARRAALGLVKDIMRRGEQVAIFSALHEPLDAMADQLREASVKFRLMDGRVSPAKRGDISSRFKSREFPVQLCGIESCAEGHSWPQASNAIVLCGSWAMDKMLQCISRVHRLTSKANVNIYFIITEGSLDPYLHQMTEEKTTSADLVIDGGLRDTESQEVNPGDLLKIAEEEFNHVDAGSFDECEIDKEWPTLRAQLGSAMRKWELNQWRLAETEFDRKKSTASENPCSADFFSQ